MTNTEKPKVFLSHSSEDKPFVRELDRALQAYGIETFLDERDIGIGEDIPHRLFKEIHAARYVCYVISSKSIASEWVKDELSKASMLEKERKGVFVLPILIERVEVPIAVNNKRCADFTQEVDKPIHERTAFRLLLKAIGIDPTHFEPKSLPSAQILLDLAEATFSLIKCLVGIRVRASQMREEWPNRLNRPDLDLLYQRLSLDRTTHLRRKIDAYETILKRLRPYIGHMESDVELRTLSELLMSFLDSSIRLPSDPHRVRDMPQSMASLAHETNVIEYSISSVLTSLLFFLGNDAAGGKHAG